MEKVQVFFEKIGLLTSQQFNDLIQYVSVNVELPTSIHKEIYLQFKYKSSIPIDLFKILYQNAITLKKDLLIKFTNKVNVELDDFINYFNF
jgi:hypothetical protein